MRYTTAPAHGLYRTRGRATPVVRCEGSNPRLRALVAGTAAGAGTLAGVPLSRVRALLLGRLEIRIWAR